MQVNMLDAKSQLSRLVKAALEGEDVIIANKGVPAVKLVPVASAKPTRKPGSWAHLKITEQQIADAFSPQADADMAKLFSLGAAEPLGPTSPAKTKSVSRQTSRKK